MDPKGPRHRSRHAAAGDFSRHLPVLSKAEWGSGDVAVRNEVGSRHTLVEFVSAPASDSHWVICTGLLDFAMPLIRYDIGDKMTEIRAPASTPFRGRPFATS